VAELLARISSKELTQWMAFYKLEPFGADAEFLGHAITASTVANVNRKKGSKTLKPVDFMPKFENQEQSTEQQIQFAAMITEAFGGEDLREE
jgi:hypothetical protein